ncbi:hypothetical protein H2198_002995 [Neophaeococcomyces mojaviensis]|uniref:Uncharacterized protein n=1 Tax=Neophaeococcomyces mojaviensis TaxID=3383035 RepID=A0ACC3ACE8_9EURO|nr:hypothetical protein H2198_002995 [Knufia sp. JES_112]
MEEADQDTICVTSADGKARIFLDRSNFNESSSTIVDPNLGENQAGLTNTDAPPAEIDQQALAPPPFTRFPGHLDFVQSLDFWNPDISFHDTIHFGGLIEPPSVLSFAPPQSISSTDGNVSQWRPRRSYQSPGAGGQAVSTRLAANSKDGKVSGVYSLLPQPGSATVSERIPPGLFIRKDALTSNFIGLNSTGATIAFCIRESLDAAPAMDKNHSFDWLVEAGSHVDEADVSGKWDASGYKLPSKEMAATSIKAYFAGIHIFYPVVVKKDFESAWEELYLQDPTQEHDLDVAVFYLITAIGTLCNKESRFLEIETQASELYQRAWALLSVTMVSPHTDTVQILLLHVIYLALRGKGGMAWIMCGLAIRHAQSIGLHRKSPRDLDLAKEQIELRSQLWWCAFTFDAFLSLTQGRPTAITEGTYDADLEAIDALSLGLTDSAHIAPNLYVWRVTLAQIQNRLCSLVNRRETVTVRLDTLADIDQALNKWRDNIPSECRPEQEILVGHDIYQLVALLHLEYFNNRNKSLAETHPSPRIRSSEAICLNAARSFVKTLNNISDVSEGDRIAPLMLYIDYYMTALSLLYRNIFRYPRRVSAKADLEHFRAGKFHFMNDIPESMISPTLKTLFSGMLKSLEDLLYNQA